MSHFATDADLLAHEPAVFVDLPFATQRKLRVTDGVLSGPTLTSEAGGFSELGQGDVVVIAVSEAERVTVAVSAVTDDGTLELDAEPVGLSANQGLTVEARTLKPQTAVVHGELMRAIGIDVDDPEQALNEQSVVSVSVMRRLEVLGTLARAYRTAVGLSGDQEELRMKAAEHERQFRSALRGARVLVDLDGDGRADVWRTPGVGRLVRV